MKKLNIFAMDIKGLDSQKRIQIFHNLRESHYQWPDGMFHRIITNKIGLNFEYNNVSKLKDLKQFSDDNKPYVIFVKFYEFRQIVGRIENNDDDYFNGKVDDEKSLIHYLFSDNQFIVDDINSDKCKFIIAGLTELSNQDYEYNFKFFNKQLKKYGIDDKKITFFDFINNIGHMKKYNKNINFKYFNWLMVSWDYYLNFPKTHRWFTKDFIKQMRFISLNHTIKQHRFLLIDFLRKNNLLEKGYVSFFHNKFKEKFFSVAEDLDWTLKQTNEFYEWLNSNPLSVDINLDYDYQKKLETNSSAPNEIFNTQTDLAYKNSYFNILTETCFFESSYKGVDEFYLNERNVLPINTFQPFIVMNGQGHMKQFNKLGFKSFHPFINESYDKEKDPTKRFKMITKEIKRLCDMNDKEIYDWYWSMEEILVHNYNHFHNDFLPKQIQGFYDEFIFE
jgi:hypothetical protein